MTIKNSNCIFETFLKSTINRIIFMNFKLLITKIDACGYNEVITYNISLTKH